jgi:hypothetical protein
VPLEPTFEKEKDMEQIRNFGWAQDKIDELTNSAQQERHEAQRVQHEVKRDPPRQFAGENRAQRRERERQERRAAKKVTT